MDFLPSLSRHRLQHNNPEQQEVLQLIDACLAKMLSLLSGGVSCKYSFNDILKEERFIGNDCRKDKNETDVSIKNQG